MKLIFERRLYGLEGMFVKGVEGEPDEHIVVPEEVDGVPVVGIGQEAFARRLGANSDGYHYDDRVYPNARIKSVTLPSTIQVLEARAFAFCYGLETINLPEGLKNISADVFYECKKLDVKIPEGVQTIGESAFEYSGLTEVVVPDSVQTIGRYAFSNCENLTSFTFGRGYTKGEEIFSRCPKLKKIVLPQGMKELGERAFLRCEGLESIEIPEGVEEIGESCFHGCYRLKSVTIPTSIKKINHNVFFLAGYVRKNQFSVPDERLDQDESVVKVEEGKDPVKTITLIFKGSCPPDFLYMWGLERRHHQFLMDEFQIDVYLENPIWDKLDYVVKMYALMTFLKDKEHYDSELQKFYEERLIENLAPVVDAMIVNNNLEAFDKLLDYGYIGANDIPALKTRLEGSGRQDMEFLLDAYQPATSEGKACIGEAIVFTKTYILRFNKKKKEVGYAVEKCKDQEMAGVVTIPASLNGIPVTEIGAKGVKLAGFGGCKKITEVILPDTIKAIHDEAFDFEENLTKINLPEGLESIGEKAFRGTGLCTIILPASLKRIGKNAFQYNKGLTEVYNLSSLPITTGSGDYGEVARYAKKIYTKLKKESDHVEQDGFIFRRANGEWTLVGYNGLEAYVKLPESINGAPYSIGEEAFREGYAEPVPLERIEIPKCVKKIGVNAFWGCVNLKRVDYKGTLADWCNISLPEKYLNRAANPLCYAHNLYIGGVLQSELVISGDVPQIGSNAFTGCHAVRAVIGQGVKKVAWGAFSDSDCPKMMELCNESGAEIENSERFPAKCCVYTPESGKSKIVKKDGLYFSHEEGGYVLLGPIAPQKEITLPADVNGESYSIHEEAFTAEYELENIFVAEENKDYSSRDGVLYNKDGTELIFYPFARKEEIYTIPYEVIKIGYNAFNRAQHLKGLAFKNLYGWEFVSSGTEKGYEAKFTEEGFKDPENIYFIWQMKTKGGYYWRRKF